YTVAQQFLEECLQDDPAAPDAVWLLTAVRWLRGDITGITAQQAAFDGQNIEDPRYHFFSALALWCAGDSSGALESASRSSSVAPVLVETGESGIHWPTETAYLMGLAQMDSGSPAAEEALKKPALAKDSPSARHAQGLLGGVHYDMSDF